MAVLAAAITAAGTYFEWDADGPKGSPRIAGTYRQRAGDAPHCGRARVGDLSEKPENELDWNQRVMRNSIEQVRIADAMLRAG
jgi:hypothetical protein